MRSRHIISGIPALAAFVGMVFIAFSAPSVVYAATDVKGLILTVVSLLNATIPIIIGLALLYFFWGLAIFILQAGDEEARKKGKAIMTWGSIAIFVMFYIFGIISLLIDTFFDSFASIRTGHDPFSDIRGPFLED